MTSAIERYNYEKFIGDDDFLAFRTALPVGSSAPDFEVIDAETSQTHLLSEYWTGNDVVIEFGSYS